MIAQLVKNLLEVQETWVQSLGWEDTLEKGKATPTPVFWPGESKDCIVHGVSRSQTLLSDFHLYILDNLPLPAICYLLGIL